MFVFVGVVSNIRAEGNIFGGVGAVFEGVEAGGLLAPGGFRPGGFEGIAPVGGEFPSADRAFGFCIWHYYRGVAQNWIRYYVSASVYVVMWSLLFFFFWPTKNNNIRIPVLVLLGTCLLEVLQLWEPDFLERLRSTLLGAGLIGTDFVWLQFPFYVLGALVAVVVLKLL